MTHLPKRTHCQVNLLEFKSKSDWLLTFHLRGMYILTLGSKLVLCLDRQRQNKEQLSKSNLCILIQIGLLCLREERSGQPHVSERLKMKGSSNAAPKWAFKLGVLVRDADWCVCCENPQGEWISQWISTVNAGSQTLAVSRWLDRQIHLEFGCQQAFHIILAGQSWNSLDLNENCWQEVQRFQFRGGRCDVQRQV